MYLIEDSVGGGVKKVKMAAVIEIPSFFFYVPHMCNTCIKEAKKFPLWIF